MNLLLELIKKVLYLIPIILVLAFLFLVVHFTFKALNISPTLKSFGSKDYLPAPGSFSGNLNKAPTPTDTPTNPTMEELNPWMKTGQYNYDGKTVDYTQANSQVRNITIGTNNTLHNGVIVTGTARDNFFNNGKFFALIVSADGKVIASTVAVAEDSVHDNTWIPWRAKFDIVPQQNNLTCTLVLQYQNTSGNPQLSKDVRIPAECN